MTGPRAHIDLGAIVDNWRMLAKRAAPAECAAVVKADAYGLGAAVVAKALAKAGARQFYVAWMAEGLEVRQALGLGPEIAVFNGSSLPALDPAGIMQGSASPFDESADLEPVLNSPEQVKRWRAIPRRRYSLHVDTGMNRLGVSPADWADIAPHAPAPHRLISHLACADEPGNPMNAQQLALFERAARLWDGARRSFASTGGVYLGSRYHFDEVRPGIGLYGGGPVPAEGPAPRPVVRLTAPILQVRDVQPGETTGYGASWTAKAPARLATVGCGYADGFLRSASNRGYAVVEGERRPILGRVSMDLIMVDVTGLSANAGDDVELLGPAMPLAEQAAAMQTIDYELLTRLGRRVRRTYSDAS